MQSQYLLNNVACRVVNGANTQHIQEVSVPVEAHFWAGWDVTLTGVRGQTVFDSRAVLLLHQSSRRRTHSWRYIWLAKIFISRCYDRLAVTAVTSYIFDKAQLSRALWEFQALLECITDQSVLLDATMCCVVWLSTLGFIREENDSESMTGMINFSLNVVQLECTSK